jgi:class 3 adenylate cyclase
MRPGSLGFKIVFSVSGLLVALIAATLLFVGYEADGFVDEQLASNLEQAGASVRLARQVRQTGLEQEARLVGSLPYLKALIEETDAITINDTLAAFAQENQQFSDLTIILAPGGQVLARTDSPTPTPIEDAGAWIAPILGGANAAGVLATPAGLYYGVAAPAAAADTLFGVVIAASAIDADYVANLRQGSQDEVVVIADQVIASTLPPGLTLPQTLPEWRQALDADRYLEIDGEQYALREVTSETDDGLTTLVLRSASRAMEPYRNIQIGLLILGLLTTAAGIGGSVALAGGITAPLAKLIKGTREVAEGNFEYRIDSQRGDEIGDLFTSFNHMVEGLREKQHMQRFVSRSTVDMIHTRTSGGERVLQTIFFSDIRGFTKMSERQSPEETVRALNRCLSLQARLVEKYQGDVDKFVGDSVVAVFAGDDMAYNAIRCAVDIQKAMRDDNRSHADEAQMDIGIGIVTGEVIMGSIGSDDRSDFTIIGSNVNLCARLCSAAGPGEILLGESTYERVRDLVAARKQESITVKGFSDPVPVYKMVPR